MSEPSKAKKVAKPRKPKPEPTKEEIAEAIVELTKAEKELETELAELTVENVMIQSMSCPNIKEIIKNSLEDIETEILETQEQIKELKTHC